MALRNGNQFVRFSGIAIQMGCIIGLGSYGGVWLDENYNEGGSLYTILLSLFSVFAALYHVYREITKISHEE